MKIGIDMGGTFTKIVKIDNDIIYQKESFLSNEIDNFENLFSTFSGEDNIFITGGKSQLIYHKLKKTYKNLHFIDEFESLCRGAKFLTKLEKAVVVSVGTGTAFIYFEENRIEQITGSGIGAGLIAGISHFFQFNNTSMELKNYNSKIDISVKDIVGFDIGKISSTAAASHLGNLSKDFSNEEILLAFFSLVGKTISVISDLVSRLKNCTDVVFLGKISENEIFQHFVFERKSELKADFIPHFPINANFANAIGATI